MYINIYHRVYPTSGKIDFFPPPLFPRRRRFMCIQYPNAISLSNDKTTGKIIFTSRRRLYDFFAHIKRKHASKYDFAPYITHTARLYIYKSYDGCSGSRVCARSPYLQQYINDMYILYMLFIFIPVTNLPAFHCPRDKRKCELSRVNAGNTYVRSAGRRILSYATAAGLVYSGTVHSKTVYRLRYIIYICPARAPDRYYTINLQTMQ